MKRLTLSIAIVALTGCAAAHEHFNARMRDDVSVQSGCDAHDVRILANSNGLARVDACGDIYVCRRASGAQAGYHGSDPFAAMVVHRWDCQPAPQRRRL